MTLEELGLSKDQLEVIDKAIQSEGDKVRTKYSKEMSELKIQLETLKPTEKSEVEIALEKRQKDLELKEQEIANKEKAYSLKEKLASNGLPSELAKYLTVGDDVDSTIEELGGTLNNYFLNSGYKPNNHSKSEGITKDQFSKMSYGERSKLFDTNPELFKKLAN